MKSDDMLVVLLVVMMTLAVAFYVLDVKIFVDDTTTYGRASTVGEIKVGSGASP